MNSEPPRVSHKPMRNLPIDPVRNPVKPKRNKADTNWCQRRMYTMDQSFPNLQTNSITRGSDRLHWFQLLRLTNREKIHSQVRKIEKFGEKCCYITPCVKCGFTRACGNPHFHASGYKISYDTRAKKVFLTSVSLQHEPKASDVITLVRKSFIALVS